MVSCYEDGVLRRTPSNSHPDRRICPARDAECREVADVNILANGKQKPVCAERSVATNEANKEHKHISYTSQGAGGCDEDTAALLSVRKVCSNA